MGLLFVVEKKLPKLRLLLPSKKSTMVKQMVKNMVRMKLPMMLRRRVILQLVIQRLASSMLVLPKLALPKLVDQRLYLLVRVLRNPVLILPVVVI